MRFGSLSRVTNKEPCEHGKPEARTWYNHPNNLQRRAHRASSNFWPSSVPWPRCKFQYATVESRPSKTGSSVS